MDQHARERFDGLLEEVLAGLPPSLHALLEEVPLIVEDRPSRQQAEELAAELGDTTAEALMEELCGLHSGPMLTERSVEELPDVPENVMLFREGIVAIAGGWAAGTTRCGRRSGSRCCTRSGITSGWRRRIWRSWGTSEVGEGTKGGVKRWSDGGWTSQK